MKTLFLISISIILLVSCKQPQTDNGIVNKNSEIAIRIDNYLKSVTSLGFSGSVVISDGENIMLQSGYGLANRESRTPYTSTTIQSCGSITKQFTAAAILLLESKDSLSVNDPLSKYFPDIPQQMAEITIHQLLTHSSGITGGIGPDEELINKQDYLTKLWAEPLHFQPGAAYAYSNSGYSLLGMIIEMVSGKNYNEFLKENFFIPLEMKNTGYFFAEADTTNLANGYREGNLWGKVYKRAYFDDGPTWHLRGNGGLHTTAEDMFKWSKMLKTDVIFSESIINRWTTGYINENNASSKYGYGLVIYEDTQYGKIISHAGSNRIFSADVAWLPDKNIFYYIQSNSSLFPAYDISKNLLSVAFDTAYSIPPYIETYDKIQPDAIKKLEGVYSIEGASIELKADDTRLMAKLRGQPMLDMFLDHSEEQRQLFNQLNERTLEALNLLKKGKTDALKNLIRANEDPIPATSNLLKQIEQIGNLESLNLIGTFENKENSRFYKFGDYTTFVHARFKNWNRYWNFVFDEQGHYKGAYSGPWPTFTLIPVDENKFTAVNQEFPHQTVGISFENNCFIIGSQKACN